MDVYLLSADADRYQWLDLVADHGQIERFHEGRPLGRPYKRIEVRVLDDRENRRLPAGDFPQLNHPVPVLSCRAVDALAELLGDGVERLPLTSDGDYCALNVTRVVHALDVERSELKRFGTGRIMRVLRYELRREAIEPVAIFKLPELLVDVYVTDAFRDAVDAAGLEGLHGTDWSGVTTAGLDRERHRPADDRSGWATNSRRPACPGLAHELLSGRNWLEPVLA